MKASSNKKKGVLLLLAAAVSFALSTVFAKLVYLGSDLPAVQVIFFRYLLGFLVLAAYVAAGRRSIRPNNTRLVLLRALFNTVTAILFFLGVQFSTVSKANMLNMTYPVYVFAIAPLINRERSRLANFIFLLLALLGIYLVISPSFGTFNIGDLFAACSGLTASLAITILRQSRKYDPAYLIIFYLMGIGCLINGAVTLPFFRPIPANVVLYLALSAVMGLMGQAQITSGYRYIDAAPGAVVTASRILFAVVLGVVVFSDSLTGNILVGGFLIIASTVGVSGLIPMKKKQG